MTPEQKGRIRSQTLKLWELRSKPDIEIPAYGVPVEVPLEDFESFEERRTERNKEIAELRDRRNEQESQKSTLQTELLALLSDVAVRIVIPYDGFSLTVWRYSDQYDREGIEVTRRKAPPGRATP